MIRALGGNKIAPVILIQQFLIALFFHFLYPTSSSFFLFFCSNLLARFCSHNLDRGDLKEASNLQKYQCLCSILLGWENLIFSFFMNNIINSLIYFNTVFLKKEIMRDLYLVLVFLHHVEKVIFFSHLLTSLESHNYYWALFDSWIEIGLIFSVHKLDAV